MANDTSLGFLSEPRGRVKRAPADRHKPTAGVITTINSDPEDEDRIRALSDKLSISDKT